jgi:hypothetical protein
MRSLKATFLLLLFSFVLAHAAVPHHHHVETPVKKDHHHHDSADHHHDNDEEGGHSVFTFSQIDDTFITFKQLTVPIIMAFVPTPGFTPVVSEEDVIVEYINKDIPSPPLILIPKHTFRGPPNLA